MSAKINSGNTTNEQDRLVASEPTQAAPVSIDAALLENVNTRAKAVLECVAKLRDSNALSLAASSVEPKLDQDTAESQEKAKAKEAKAKAKEEKAARFLGKVEKLVKRVKHAVNVSSRSELDDAGYQQCQKDLKSLRRLAASTYAKAAGYAALATLVGLLTFAASLFFGVFGLGFLITAYDKRRKNMSLDCVDKFVIQTAEAAADFTIKLQRSFKLAATIGLFGGMQHQAKKTIEAHYQLQTPKNTK